MDPVGALIGSVLLGFGIVVFYGAIKNRKVFGAQGIVTTALTTGTISNLEKLPEAFPTITQGDIEKLAQSEHATWVLPRAVRSAVTNIAQSNPSLGESLARELDQMDSDSTAQDLVPLSQLLTIADGQGHKIDADVIRLYVKELTGESV